MPTKSKSTILCILISICLLTQKAMNTYSNFSTLTIASVIFLQNPPFDIQKDPSVLNKFTIKTSATNSKSYSTTQSLTINENLPSKEFSNTGLITLTTASESFNLSIVSDSCLFPFVFGSQLPPVVTLSENKAELETLSNLSDFETLYGESKQFTSVSYTKTNNTYPFVNIFCSFYKVLDDSTKTVEEFCT